MNLIEKMDVVEKLKRKAQKVIHAAKKISALSELTDFAGEKSSINSSGKSKISTEEMISLMGMDYSRFSGILPYRYFDTDDDLYINDQSVGFGLELSPLSGANEEIINALSELIKNKIKEDICVQIMMMGSNKVGSLLSNIVMPTFDEEIFATLSKNQYEYLKHSAIKGFSNKRNIPMQLKDYRCFLFVSKKTGYSKRVAAEFIDLRDEIKSELKNTGIPSVTIKIESFLQLIFEFVNPNQNCIDHPFVRFDKHKTINEQCTSPDFFMRVFPDELTIESETRTPLSEDEKLLSLKENESLSFSDENQKIQRSKCSIVSLSLKQLPEELALWAQADNFSNIFKPNHGINCPFVISVHFKCEPQERSKLKAFKKASGYEKKANSPYAKLIPGTVQAAADWKKIRDDLSTNETKLCKVYFNCVLFTDEKSKRDHVSNAISAFRLNGFDLYPVRFQQLQSYLSMLPFVVEQGLWFDLSTLGRLNTMTTWNLSNMVPLVAEYKGSGRATGIFAPTFRHQAMLIDIFDPNLDNYNACICATSGSGKSVLSQSLVTSVLSDGGQAWVIDLGESYKKFCKTINGTYMDVENLRLNPFSTVTDITRSAESIRDLIAVMASPNVGLSDVQKAYLLDAVNSAFKTNQNKSTIDDVINYLSSIDFDERGGFDTRVDDMVTLLKKYSIKHAGNNSISAKIFNEGSQLNNTNPGQSKLIVLELGKLEKQPDLLKAVLFALILHIEEKMYHDKSGIKKICVIDEAWRLLSGSNETAARFIEKGYRTSRKHNASFVTITQQINDFYASTEAQAAWSCAETKIIMRQNEKAFKDFLIKNADYFDSYQQTLIKSFRPSAISGFSEFMLSQGAINSFHRLFLDPLARIMYSSKASEHNAVESLISDGKTVSQAIEIVARTQFKSEMASIKSCN